MLSPGPCTPNEAGICLALIAGAPDDLPILGVCLGHQSIGQALGGEVIRAKTPDARQDQPDPPRRPGHLRGPAQPLHRDALPQPLGARAKPCRPSSRSPPGPTTARSWASRIATRPVHGVQFHPESIATEGGHQLLANFLELAGVKRLAEA